MIIEFDDFGASHTISDQCQSHDCRDQLDRLHLVNPNFKVTLFAIPGEMTYELLEWCKANNSWVELSVHGFYHKSNYECAEMDYLEFDFHMEFFEDMIEEYFVHGFRAPGWQISDGAYEWLLENDWWVADQSSNDQRRPKGLSTYANNNGAFYANLTPVEAHHGHVWNCCGNGIDETFDYLSELVKTTDDFKFVSEVMNENS